MYQRGGSIIPKKMRVRRSSTAMANDPYTLVVALDIGQAPARLEPEELPLLVAVRAPIGAIEGGAARLEMLREGERARVRGGLDGRRPELAFDCLAGHDNSHYMASYSSLKRPL